MKNEPPVRKILALALRLLAASFGATGRSADAVRSPGDLGSNAYSVEFWNEAKGFPQSRIRAIVQSRDGYLWLGADRGLARFDGVGFTMFDRSTGDLRDNEIWTLAEDRDGGLWIGTGGGLTLYKDGIFRTFTKADGLPDDWVRALDIDRDGNVWIACANGVACWAAGKFTSFTAQEGPVDNLPIRVCARSSLGVLLVGIAALAWPRRSRR